MGGRKRGRSSRRALLGTLGGFAAATLRVRSGVPAPVRRSAVGSIDALSLPEKAARLFMVPVAGTALTAEETDWLETWRPGGVILVGANIGTPAETRALIAAIHATNPDRPPRVAVDQEGGLVSRLPGDPAPGAPELARLPDDEVRALSRERGEYLAGYGVDVNFAPVADVAWTADSAMAGRTFGDDPALVAEKVAAVVEGAAGTGVRHAAKHFPGHGRATLDSHEALPTIALSRQEWLATDAVPFAAAIQAGVPLVMLGHLRYSLWDDLPASLSPVAVGELRDALGFAGAVVTDDLGMGALAAYDPAEVVDLALAAGVDLLLYVIPPVPIEELIRHVVARVEAGELAEARLGRSLGLLDRP